MRGRGRTGASRPPVSTAAMKCATSAREIFPPPRGGYSGLTRYCPVPGPLTSLVARTRVQSRPDSRITSSIPRTSANGLAKIRGRICLTSQLMFGSPVMNAPAADTQTRRLAPVCCIAPTMFDAAPVSRSGVAGCSRSSGRIWPACAARPSPPPRLHPRAPPGGLTRRDPPPYARQAVLRDPGAARVAW
jgi:hypothetical protein